MNCGVSDKGPALKELNEETFLSSKNREILGIIFRELPFITPLIFFYLKFFKINLEINL